MQQRWCAGNVNAYTDLTDLYNLVTRTSSPLGSISIMGSLPVCHWRGSMATLSP